MNHEDFSNIVEARLSICQNILASKNEEYSSDTDRLHNFKMAAGMSDTTPEQALWGMWVKHLVSVRDLVDAPDDATPELIKEKISDSINYLLLLEGLLTERMNG